MSSFSLEGLLDEALGLVAVADDLRQLKAVRVRFLGRKGELTAQLKQLSDLPAAERRSAGQAGKVHRGP